MGALFERLFSRHMITYDPKQWSKRLGEKCDKCEKNLTHEKCISLCNCYYFAHDECFKTEFEKQIYSRNTDVRCSQCKKELRMELSSNFKYSPMVTKWKILKVCIGLLLLILTVVGILLTLDSQLKIQIAFFVLYVEGVILSIILYGLVTCTREIFYRKVVKIQSLLSTKLDIQTSAFKDIQLETNEQLTKDCLFTTKK